MFADSLDIEKSAMSFSIIIVSILKTLKARSWQMPALAILSGQKSAPESIQAPDYI